MLHNRSGGTIGTVLHRVRNVDHSMYSRLGRVFVVEVDRAADMLCDETATVPQASHFVSRDDLGQASVFEVSDLDES